MTIQYFPFHLEFKYPFRLSHTERTGTDNVYILLDDGINSGWGETVFIPYYPERIDDFKKTFEDLKSNEIDLMTTIQNLLKKYPDKRFSIAGIDIAIHNWFSNKNKIPIHEIYHLNPNTKETSFTLGISDFKEMEQKVNENLDRKYFKLKVSQGKIDEIISNYRKLTNKPFTIDANQGFSDRNAALNWAKKLCDLGVEYMEQPFHKEDLDSHKWLKDRSPIPILADESFQIASDLEILYKYFDGVNVKLMKCGGISEGYKALYRAKEMEMKTIIGCMSESSIGCDAANEIASLADWTDLDGKHLITNDLFQKKLTQSEIINVLK